MPRRQKDPKAVFVVHGRNFKAREALFTFLKEIGLHPLEWSEAREMTGEGTPYIGDILKKALSTAQAIIVLMTPDDEARLRLQFRGKNDELYDTELTPQVRPNVLFEAGWAMGIAPKNTILVELGKVRPFSDVHGRHVIRLDNSREKREELIKRLETAKCPVVVSGEYWLEAGDFQGALAGDMLGADDSAADWTKSGAIWWLCSDIIDTLGRVRGGASRELIVDGLKRTHNHANQLHLGDAIVGKLQQLRDEAIASRDDDWTLPKRETVGLEVRRIFNSVGQLAIEHQKKNHPDGFKSDPD